LIWGLKVLIKKLSSMHLRILGSSSSGNCALLSTAGTKVLIEAGFSGKRIEAMLAEVGESIHDIEAIFISHEHSDHIVGLRGLARHKHIQFFANRETAQAVEKMFGKKFSWKLFETGSTFRFKDIDVENFSIPHDAYDPVGFIFRSGDGTLFAPDRSLAWVTDLGYVSDGIAEKIRAVDVLVLEANYDEGLLDEDTKRPFSVKQRIRGRHGHLSNEASCALLARSEGQRWRHVVLAHLSKECNSVERVRSAFAPLFEASNRFQLSVVDPLMQGGLALDLAHF